LHLGPIALARGANDLDPDLDLDPDPKKSR